MLARKLQQVFSLFRDPRSFMPTSIRMRPIQSWWGSVYGHDPWCGHSGFISEEESSDWEVLDGEDEDPNRVPSPIVIEAEASLDPVQCYTCDHVSVCFCGLRVDSILNLLEANSTTISGSESSDGPTANPPSSQAGQSALERYQVLFVLHLYFPGCTQARFGEGCLHFTRIVTPVSRCPAILTLCPWQERREHESDPATTWQACTN